MKRAAYIFLIPALLGCSRDPEPIADAKYLATVAACFHIAVSEMQAEPESPEVVGAFLRDAIATTQKRNPRALVAEASDLRWASGGDTLVSPRGNSVSCKIVAREHDNLADGASWNTTYEFSTLGGAAKANVDITLTTK